MELSKQELIQVIKILLKERFPPEKHQKAEKPQEPTVATSVSFSSHTYYPSAGMYWNGIQYVSNSDKKQG